MLLAYTSSTTRNEDRPGTGRDDARPWQILLPTSRTIPPTRRHRSRTPAAQAQARRRTRTSWSRGITRRRTCPRRSAFGDDRRAAHRPARRVRRPVRTRIPPRHRRVRLGLSRPRPPAGPPRRDEGVTGDFRRPGPAAPRGPLARPAQPPRHRRGVRCGCRRAALLRRLRTAPRSQPVRLAEGTPAVARGGGAHRRRGGRRAGPRPRQEHRPPRPEAEQRGVR